MAKIAYNISTFFVEVGTCSVCGILFGLENSLYNRRLSDGKEFYCPNGHRQYFTDSEVTRLKKEKEQLEKTLTATRNSRDYYQNELNQEKKSKAAIKGNLTKLKKRVSNGVCPCCNRSFSNLERHIKHMHPEFK